MSLVVITGSLQGTYVNNPTGWGQVYALTDSEIEINGTLGSARFSLPKGQIFGTVAYNGATPFPNDITDITVWGQGEVLAFTTTPTGGGGGGGGVGFTSVSQSATFPYTVSFLSGSTVLASYNPTGAATASFALTASQAISSSYAVTASFVSGTVQSSSFSLTASYIKTAQTASYIDVTGSGILVNWNGPQLQLTASTAAQGNYFSPLIELGPTTNTPSASGNWRLITSGSNLNFEYWNTGSNSWILDTYLDGTPFSGSGGSGGVGSFNFYYLEPSNNQTLPGSTDIIWTGSAVNNISLPTSNVSQNTSTGVFTLSNGNYLVEWNAAYSAPGAQSAIILKENGGTYKNNNVYAVSYNAGPAAGGGFNGFTSGPKKTIIFATTASAQINFVSNTAPPSSYVQITKLS